MICLLHFGVVTKLVLLYLSELLGKRHSLRSDCESFIAGSQESAHAQNPSAARKRFDFLLYVAQGKGVQNRILQKQNKQVRGGG